MSDKITCEKCGKEVPKFAGECPSCGAKLKNDSFKNALIVFGILGVFIIIGIVMMLNNSGQSNGEAGKSQIQSGVWDTSSVDAMVNNNVPIAAGLLKAPEDTRKKAVSETPANVIKTPSNYYGEILKFKGKVAIIAGYPAGSEFSKIFGGKESSEIAIITEDGTIVDSFLGTPKGDIKKNDEVTVYGYPVGRTVIANNEGAEYERLMIVGNVFDK